MDDHPNAQKIRFAIDRGGTFTDVYAECGDTHYLIKLLSEDPRNYADAPSEGIRRIMELITGKAIQKGSLTTDSIASIRMGTTLATNALLERKGARTALLITKGFRDLLRIGYQNRPNIFDLKIERPEVLYETVLEINERVRPAHAGDPVEKTVCGVNGAPYIVLQQPDLSTVKKDLLALKETGIESVAILLLHSYAFHDHELQIGQLAHKLGFTQISLSSEVMPMIKAVCRGDTTVVDAYLTPHIRRYLETFRHAFIDGQITCSLEFMQSSGGLSPAETFRGSNAILSGPAGGVVGYAQTTFEIMNRKPIIGFDMGGTSTDVSRFDGTYQITHENETAGVHIQAPQLEIHTVAAGGGSRLFFTNNMFVVGPDSSGANPGPVCYRKGGYLSVTDANLLLGRLQPAFFPHIFGENEDMPLDTRQTATAFKALTARINEAYCQSDGRDMTPEAVAEGFLDVANATMARAVREISTMRGHTLHNHILATFGGAGGQHACAIARMLGIPQIYIHRFSGILSAYGMRLADTLVEEQQPASLIFSEETLQTVTPVFAALEKQARHKLTAQGFSPGQITIKRFLNLRYQGTNTAFMVMAAADEDYEKAFRKKHRLEFGFELAGRVLMVDDIRIQALGHGEKPARVAIPAHQNSTHPAAIIPCYFGKFIETPVYRLETLGSGFTLKGPALIVSDTATIVIEPACTLVINTYGDLIIDVPAPPACQADPHKDPIQLSIFSNLFMSIAEQMGRTLQRTAISTNIKERLDYSCALFDQRGRLVANAPHIPVHLGAMESAVQKQIELCGKDLQPGDVLMTNHPAFGGSHLPDITVITPVWKNGSILFYTASRGHHADIGGTVPGSMPPFSQSLSEEGACIASLKLVTNTLFNEQAVRLALDGARRIEDNISDLKGQIAANKKGAELLLDMVDLYSLETVMAYMSYLQESAEQAVRTMLKEICRSNSSFSEMTLKANDRMDDGTVIALAITLNGNEGSAHFDFRGSGRQVAGNWNTPEAIVYSTILYCLQCLTQSSLPLNHGCLKPITVTIPQGSLLSPSPDAAIVGGNVLTSQRIADVILKAFKAAAASQGCMNSVSFGNESFGYYETIGGGAGAGPDWHGQSGVHTHMTNTRITDPEILETRYPIMLHTFSIRSDSGGNGFFKGGDGLIREYEALANLQFSILSERRVFPPFGLRGGENGKTGSNILCRLNEEPSDMGGKNSLALNPGDHIIISTPGGGGYGQNVS